MQNISALFNRVKDTRTNNWWWILQVTDTTMLCFCQVKLPNARRVQYPYGIKDTTSDKMQPLGTANSQEAAKFELQKYFNTHFEQIS